MSAEGEEETKNVKRIIEDISSVAKVADVLGVKLPVGLESSYQTDQPTEVRPLVDYQRVRANRAEWKRVLRSAGYEPGLMGPTLASTSHPLEDKKVRETVFFERFRL